VPVRVTQTDRQTDRQTNSAENSGPSGLQSGQYITIHVYTSVSSSFRGTLTQRLKCRRRSFSSVVAAREREPIMGVLGGHAPMGCISKARLVMGHGSKPPEYGVYFKQIWFFAFPSQPYETPEVSLCLLQFFRSARMTNDRLNHSVHKPIAWL